MKIVIENISEEEIPYLLEIQDIVLTNLKRMKSLNLPVSQTSITNEGVTITLIWDAPDTYRVLYNFKPYDPML